MKYYQQISKLHKWLGVILAIVLIAGAVTSYILLAPWMKGIDKSQPVPGTIPSIEVNKSPATQEATSKENFIRNHNRNNTYGMDDLD